MRLQPTRAARSSQSGVGNVPNEQPTSGYSNFPFLRVINHQVWIRARAPLRWASFFQLRHSSSSSILFWFTPLTALILHACTEAAVVWAAEKLSINILSHVLAGHGRRRVACCAAIPWMKAVHLPGFVYQEDMFALLFSSVFNTHT